MPATSAILATMYRLSVCTKPRDQSYVAIDDVKLLATSLESMFELIVDGTDLSRLTKLPKEVRSLVLSHLAPFPEVVALAQTRALLHQLQSSRATCDSIVFANINTRLYPSTLIYQGREYISLLSNRYPRRNSRYREVELSGDHIFITLDNFGLRDVSSSYRKVLRLALRPGLTNGHAKQKRGPSRNTQPREKHVTSKKGKNGAMML
jgi:hypothetical protein